jgi:hypothetical protein
MKKTCPISGREFELREQDLAFYKKMDVPVPEIHPDEILRKLMACRNEWKLYRRKCDKTGDTIISAYHENTLFPVYKNEEWWGDSWDGTDYGQGFDKGKPFFEQFLALRNKVPREGTSVFNSENCDYNSHTRESKNCYLCSRTYQVEDCYYASWLVNVKDIVDCWRMIDSELCYECQNCVNCFENIMTQECNGCSNCAFSYQLTGCDHCIGCSNLNHKSYHVFNKQVTKEEYEKMHKKIFNGESSTWKQGVQFFKDMWSKADHRFAHNLKGENVIGDLLNNCKNCWHTVDGYESEDCAYNVSCDQSQNIWHCFSTGWPRCELCHHSAVIRGSTDIRFSYYIWFSNNMTYCDSCASCQDCFGCVGLRHKKYCILNKEYSKEAYFVLRDKIIALMKENGEWGTLPLEFSTFAYNETANDCYFPLSQKEAERMGFKWQEDTKKEERTDAIVNIPDSLDEIGDDIIGKPLVCEKTGKYFSIIKKEFEFYKKMKLPLPRICPEERIQERRNRRNRIHFFKRKCDECSTQINSTFPPDRPERVLCEKCYLASVD